MTNSTTTNARWHDRVLTPTQHDQTEDAHMLEFALKWRHWEGGRAEDIFVEFGLTVHEYFYRLFTMLNNRPILIRRLDSCVIEQLRLICRARLDAEHQRQHRSVTGVDGIACLRGRMDQSPDV